MTVQVLHKDSLPRGGFAGLHEHRLVMDPKVFSISSDFKSWSGMGNFVYLADARFIPYGETCLHQHKEIDVISVIVDGRISHEGTLEEGNVIKTNQVQVQRAGGQGFAHNEVNPDDKENRMIQMWVVPEKSGEPAGYKLYTLQKGKTVRVYGGIPEDPYDTFSSQTVIDVGLLDSNQRISFTGEFIAYVTRGSGKINGERVSDGNLIRGNDLDFHATEDDTQIIIVRKM